jgi:hypothetical protein
MSNPLKLLPAGTKAVSTNWREYYPIQKFKDAASTGVKRA